MIFREQFSIGGVVFNSQVTLVIVLGTILPMLDWYGHSPVRALLDFLGIGIASSVKAYDRIIYYFVIPLLVIWFVFREPARAYGLQWGNWREGLFWTLVGCVGMSLILWVVARSTGMQSYYVNRAPDKAWYLVYITAVDLLGWEFIWRGFMLFALAKWLGPGPAIFIQAIPFAFMHLNKPEIETLSTIFGGAAFGFVAWRTNSFAYPFFIHWYIASFTQLIALGRF